MNILDKIKNSPSLRMALSELLFKALEMGEWHEAVSTRTDTNVANRYRPVILTKCTCKGEYWGGDFESHAEYDNPDLFIPESFMIVWEAVKDREDFQEEFYWGGDCLHVSSIAVPHFPYEVLKWLNPDGLDRVMREERE